MESTARELGAKEAASLDADEALLPFLPSLLQDLWALGLGPEPAVRLLERNLELFSSPRVLDLGCGKGALLIRLATEFGWHGYGVDILPAFIEEARSHASRQALGRQVDFEVNDMNALMERGDRAELVCFGYDSEALGTLVEALTRLRVCIAPEGWLLLELSWALSDGDGDLPSEAAALQAIREAWYEVHDIERYDAAWVAAQERENTRLIRQRAEELARENPDRAWEFAAYVSEQEEESRRLVEEAQCVSLLLRPATPVASGATT